MARRNLDSIAFAGPLLAQDTPAAETKSLPKNQQPPSCGCPGLSRINQVARYGRHELPRQLPDGVSVDLIGAVHIGEREYYEELNRRFDHTMCCYTNWW